VPIFDDMSVPAPSPATSPAFQQLQQWYEKAEAVSQAKPIPLLVTTGAPLEAADEPKETDPTTQINLFA
jgi:hypothetical protein